ncbi:hypothetical protein JTB14_013318 [Gonioctena quinquepunctata]|nr:hypothetical protein JTB14_013318 [Gonioctena quinquepunctata]
MADFGDFSDSELMDFDMENLDFKIENTISLRGQEYLKSTELSAVCIMENFYTIPRDIEIEFCIACIYDILEKLDENVECLHNFRHYSGSVDTVIP